MKEALADRLELTAQVLRYLGRYDESNALILLARLLRKWNVEDVDALQVRVELEGA